MFFELTKLIDQHTFQVLNILGIYTMSNRGKRGVAKGSKHFEGAVYEVKFNNKKLPYGKTSSRFMNDFNRACEKHFPYWMEWKKIKGEVWDHVWESIKV